MAARKSNVGVSFKEPALIALETLRTHKLRSFLTLLGVILSVSTLIVVVSMINGTNRYISQKVANFGANVFQVSRFPLITSFDEFLRLQKRNKIIVWDDYLFLHDNMRLAKAVAASIDGRLAKLKYKGDTLEDVTLNGVTGNMAEMDTKEPELGRYIVDADNTHRSNVVMIGADVTKRFFKSEDPDRQNALYRWRVIRNRWCGERAGDHVWAVSGQLRGDAD